MMWQVIASGIDDDTCYATDTGGYGYRVGVSHVINGDLHSFVLPVRFGLRSDCERAVEFMNAECPTGKDLMETVLRVEKRFTGAMGWKAEVVPIACRF